MKAKLVNESLNELNKETYLSAADKLRKIGHKNRANNLYSYTNNNEL